jgi:hypothetical protein
LAILVVNPFALLDGVEHQTPYTTKNYVNQVLKKMNLCDKQWKRKAWSKLLEYLKIQAFDVL